jgi:AAA+ superfamily predicted ATPase
MSHRFSFSHIFFAAILLVSSIQTFGMEELLNPQFRQRSASFTSNDNNDNDSRSEDNEALEFGELNDKFDENLFAESYARVPVDIDRMVRRSLDPDAPKLMSKIISLVGPTGSGKSILARAIAWKMKRNYIFVSSLDLLGSVLHKGAENVKALFKGIRRFNNLPALIVDEANFLGDDYIKGNSDAKFTVSQLWSKCDALADRNDFLLIMTGNDYKNLPHPLQDRIMMHFYELPYLPFAPERLKLLVEKHNGYSLVASEASVNEFTQRIQPFSTRVINDMIDYAIGLAWDRTDKQVTAQDLNIACDRALLNRQRYCDFTPHVVPEERRHRESLTQNRELSDRSHNLSTVQHAASIGQGAQHHAASFGQSAAHHAASFGQSAAHHRASIRQNYTHHEESHAQSVAAHAQSAAHHRASFGQNAQHHAASQQQVADHHNASQRLTRDIHVNSQEVAEYLHHEAQAAQELQFIQGVRAQVHMSLNNLGASVGASAGAGGAGVNGGASVGNIGKKDHVYAYAFTARQLAINAELNRASDGRVTTMVGEVGAAVPRVRAAVGIVAGVAFGLH